MLATRRGLALAPSWYARAHTRALRYTCACLRANFLCRSLTRFEFDGEAWSKYFSRRRDTQSGFVRRLNSTLTSNPSLKYSLHGSFVFCSEIYLSLFLVCSLFIRFKIFSIRFLFSFFWKNFLHNSATLNLFTLHYTVPHESTNQSISTLLFFVTATWTLQGNLLLTYYSRSSTSVPGIEGNYSSLPF